MALALPDRPAESVLSFARVSATWYRQHRARISLWLLPISTAIAAQTVLRSGPWGESLGLWIAVSLALLVVVRPSLALFLATLLLAVRLAESSIALAAIQTALALFFLTSSSWALSRIGFWTPLILLAPWATAHDVVFLPLFIGAFLFARSAPAWAATYGAEAALWAAILGRPTGFTAGPALDVTERSDLVAWAQSRYHDVGMDQFSFVPSWLDANSTAILVLLLAVIGGAMVVEWGVLASNVDSRLRFVLAAGGATALAAGSLGYLRAGSFGAEIFTMDGLVAGFLSVAVGALAGVLLEPPADPFAPRLSWNLGTDESVPNSPQRPPSSEPQAPPKQMRPTRWTDIGGYSDVKEEIREAIAPLVDAGVRAALERARLPITKGILLYGPPGVGKTLFARAIATETRMQFIPLGGAEFFSKWVGESEKRLREIFAQARSVAPSVIFFDELEAFLQPRDQVAGSSTSTHSQSVVATFLTEMDGFVGTQSVLVVGATNYPDQIDPAAIRPGRFDKVIFIPPPDPGARSAIWQTQLAGRPGAADLDIDALVATTERFTGADIEGVVNESYRAAVRAKRKVTTDDLLALAKQTKPTVTLDMLERFEALARKYGRRATVAEAKPMRERTRLTWDGVAGMDEVKQTLREIVELPLKHPDLYAQYRLRPSRGVLLYGPPGCGKTLFARTLADESDATFLSVAGPELLRSGLGESEKRVRALFREARENKPCIVFFDEIDAIAGHRGEGPVTLQVVNQLLTELDGMEGLAGVVVLAATNRPDALDAALLRPGRFDRLVYVGLPDLASRRAQIATHLAGRPAEVDLDTVAERSDGYTGAEIAFIVNEAALVAMRAAMDGTPRPVRTEDLLELMARTPRAVSHEDASRYESLRSFQR